MTPTSPGVGTSRRVIMGVVVILLVIALLATFAVYSSQPKGTTSPTVSSMSSSATSSSSLSISSSVSSSTTQSISSSSSSSSEAEPCSTPVNSAPYAFTLQSNSQSPALLCVDFYYYNQTSPITLNTFSQINILGMRSYPNGTGAMFNANSNFTITSSSPSITIGGPSNQNEGTAVTYSIAPKDGTNGMFALNIGWLLPGKTSCNEEFVLVAGSGSPNYTYAGLCSDISGGSAYPAGYIFAEITGVTNSTIPSS